VQGIHGSLVSFLGHIGGRAKVGIFAVLIVAVEHMAIHAG